MFPDFDYETRIDTARQAMEAAGVDLLLLSLGADLPYLTGYEGTATERLTVLVLPAEDQATLLVPRLEEPRVVRRGDAFAVRAWEETEDPVAVAASLAGDGNRVAIGDQMWAGFLLRFQSAMPGAGFVSASGVTRLLRMQKDAAEIEHLREAAAAVDRVVARLDATRFSGRTESDLSREVRAMTIEEGHHADPFASVASGPNGASPHHDAAERVIEAGDAVVVDFGARRHGYWSDTTRTFVVGDPDPKVAEAFAVLEEAQAVGRAAVAPGVPAQEVDRATRRVITDAGWGDYFVHRTGHGIGLEVHEEPYLVEGNPMGLEEGMAFSIEPGIYVTGEFGMRIEDIVAVGPDGVDELNVSPRGLHVVA